MTNKLLKIVALLCIIILSACDKTKREDTYLDVYSEGILLDQSGKEGTFNIKTNSSWSCEISPLSARDWLILECLTDGPGEHMISVSATPNQTYDKREAIIDINAGGVIKPVNIVQKPALGVEVAENTFNIKQEGGQLKVIVSSNTWLNVKTLGEWIHRKENTRSMEAKQFNFVVDPNETYNIRLGKIAFSDSQGVVSDTIFVYQQAATPFLIVTPSSLDYSAANSTEYLKVETGSSLWSVAFTSDVNWCTAVKSGTKAVKVQAKANYGERREATIRITDGENIEDIVLTQGAFDSGIYYGDKQAFRLQQSTIGGGVNLIVLGDGYTLNDMTRDGKGKYEKDMRAAADHFFSVYPYSAYRDYFNVYMVTAISNEAGMSSTSPTVTVDTKFETLWESTSTAIDCNDITVKEYATTVTTLTGKPMKDMTVIMPINRDVYAGTCIMWVDGFSIAMTPVCSSFSKLVAHEAGGHGFAKLMDEYIYYQAVMPNDIKKDTQAYKAYGFYINVDFSENILETTWSGFANKPKYSMVRTYSGAYMYSRGIWRPEYNSCMNDNVPYFNAPSRWAQMKRIHQLAGLPYSFDQFLLEDEIPPYALSAKTSQQYLEPFIPSGPPIVITTPSDN